MFAPWNIFLTLNMYFLPLTWRYFLKHEDIFLKQVNIFLSMSIFSSSIFFLDIYFLEHIWIFCWTCKYFSWKCKYFSSICNYFSHLEHVRSENLNIVLPELSEDHFAKLGEEYYSIPEKLHAIFLFFGCLIVCVFLSCRQPPVRLVNCSVFSELTWQPHWSCRSPPVPLGWDRRQQAQCAGPVFLGLLSHFFGGSLSPFFRVIFSCFFGGLLFLLFFLGGIA